jgi:hypothetical protein
VPGVILAGLLLLIECIFLVPRTIAPSRSPKDLQEIDGLTSKDRVQLADDRRRLQNDIRTALLQGVTGGAVLVGLLFAWQQQQTTIRQQRVTTQQVNDQLRDARQAQTGERFSRAVSQLGNDKSVDVRLGGIYELEQLARQADDRRLVIYEVLAAYIRRHAPSASTPLQYIRRHRFPVRLISPNQVLRVRAPDVQAALTVLGRRRLHVQDPILDLSISERVHPREIGISVSGDRGLPLDLTGANLRGVDLRGVDLSRVELYFADLSGAKLGGVNLSDADLIGANLSGADLTDADLSFAELIAAHMRGTNLSGVDLSGATVTSDTEWPEGFDWEAHRVRDLKDVAKGVQG